MQWLGTHLEATYGITVDALSKPQAWNPHVFRVDRRDGPPWIARAFPPARPAEQVRGDAAILRFLEESAFPAERCAADEPVSAHDGHHVLVTTFVAGGEPRDWRAIGERLGWLHSLPVPDGVRDGGSWHGDPAHEGSPACDVAHGQAVLDAVAGRVPAHAGERFESLRARVASLDAAGGLPVALVHPDPGPVNAIDSDDGVVFIDWAGSGAGPRLASLALTLTAGAPEQVVAGYREHVPSLTDDELGRLGAVMKLRPWFWAAYYYAMTVNGSATPSGGEGWWPNDAAIDAAARRAVDAFTT